MFSPSCHNPLDSAIHIKNIHIKKKKKKELHQGESRLFLGEKRWWRERTGVAGFHHFSKRGISNSLRSKAASCQLLLLFAEIFNQAIASSNICE